MYTQFNSGYQSTFSQSNRNVMYGVKCDILSKEGASHMNGRTTLSDGRTAKVNGSRMVVIQAMQDNFEITLEI
jgi:hypothetical protein